MEEKRKIQKPKYNMWQNTGFMLRNAWETNKSVIFLCIALAVITASRTIAELFITPVILHKLETEVPVLELVQVIIILSLILLILSGLKAYIDTNTLFGRIGVRMKLVEQIGNKLAETSYPNILDTEFIKTEEKARRAVSSNDRAAEHIWAIWTDIITDVLGFFFYLMLLSNLNPLLAGVVMVTTAVGYLINKRINEWGYRHKEEEAAYDKSLGYIQDTATGREYAKDIRIFGLKGWLDDLWHSTIKLYQAFLARREKVYLWANVVDILLTLLRNGIAYAYLFSMVLTEDMSASQFLLYFTAVSGFTQWVTGILNQFSILHKESLELTVIREFLEWPEPFSFENAQPLQKAEKYEIRLEQVSFRYPHTDKDTIRGIDLTIHPGEKLAVVGLNGAGKTTLIKLICGFLDPTQGRVLLNGIDIRTYNRRDYYALFSAVFQDFSVLEANVAENVAQQTKEIDEKRVWGVLGQAGLTDKIRALPDGIYTRIGRKVFEDGVELSGGETQRLMLARALYKDGAILTLDEPTAALDPIAENDIYMKYHEMSAGKTSLFISHRLASTRFCDRILFLENGRIAEEGTHEKLLSQGGGYAGLFEIQSRYYKEGGAHDGE
ncbi:MAG: ABC transporter ATP-binding protein [Lachnospiraceae bacterium]|nr:ABC transporter ATP-binding protein [Lachnospiraceae bacterium]